MIARDVIARAVSGLTTRDVIATAVSDPYVGFRFWVAFIGGNLTLYPLDFRFQKVSGLKSDIETQPVREGGQNLFTHRLPTGVKYGNLVLERGKTLASSLSVDVNLAMGRFRIKPAQVLVSLLNEDALPTANWLFRQAYPVHWSLSDLDAQADKIVVERIELAYSSFTRISL